MPRKRTLNHEEVVALMTANPTYTSEQIAKLFGAAPGYIRRIRRSAGIVAENHGGIPPKRRHGQTEEEHKWETILCRAGLGMDRGLRLGGKRVFYGHDVRRMLGASSPLA